MRDKKSRQSIHLARPLRFCVYALLLALIYVIAGLCVIRLRKRQPDAARAFRIRGGLFFPILTLIVFGLLGILAGLAPGTPGVMLGLPLIITIVMMGLSALYVFLVIPKLRSTAAARQALRRRRPPREAPGTEVS